ncbi:unnamed protein product, partial [Callosobruchus maculatus]
RLSFRCSPSSYFEIFAELSVIELIEVLWKLKVPEPSLISRFEEHKINNLSVVKSLEINDIKELIPALGDRKKIISHVNNLNDTQNDV